MKRLAALGASALLFIVLGCVIRTEHKIDAHITLDIRHVEQEVGGVFDYVEGSTDQLPEIAPRTGEQPVSWLRRTGDVLFPARVACAAESETSALLEEIAESMRKRYPEVAKWKANRVLGENNRGYVEVRSLDPLADNEKKGELTKHVQDLAKEENKDRTALYKEFARLKKLDVTIIERIGAKDKLKRAKKGEWVQLPAPSKDFDEFKASQAGRKLGDTCQPNAWVRMPEVPPQP